jgi:hypothetical protein
MVPALILAISIVALLRFALTYWRATLAGVAGQQLSAEVRAAARLEKECVTGRDFAALAGVHSLTPGSSAGVAFVGLYYHIVEGIGYIAKGQTAIATWAEREMAVCAHYVAVQVDRRLQLSLGQQA